MSDKIKLLTQKQIYRAALHIAKQLEGLQIINANNVLDTAKTFIIQSHNVNSSTVEKMANYLKIPVEPLTKISDLLLEPTEDDD
ncbi:MAG: hypothetical protein HND52_03670 [Ignavibacteriae bacterium]|nr:hypothetical protein [Ignavibacteriota bacterium]